MAEIEKTPFLTLDPFLGAAPKHEKKATGFSDAEFMLNLLKKNSFRKIKYSRSSPDPENSQCDHQQPFNFFSVFADFRRLSDNSWKQKLVYSKEKN